MNNLGNKELKLGVIGLSDGNGHPYSWSAIFNGCDMAYMKDCGFPVIPEYLSKQRFPDDCIPNAHVTHIWTQDRAVSEHVAKASLIPNVVDRMEDMIGEVDAVLLARDDPENHTNFATITSPYTGSGRITRFCGFAFLIVLNNFLWLLCLFSGYPSPLLNPQPILRPKYGTFS